MKPTKEDREETESWKSVIAGKVVLKKYNLKGQLEEFPVYGGRTFQITPYERRIYQEECANAELDPFQNGMLSPVRLIDSEEDTEELKANTNAMSETAMKSMFNSQLPTFTKKVKEISNPIALRRLLEVAEEVDASIKQQKIIKDRIAEVSPQVTEATLQAGPDMGSRMRPVSPK